MPVKLQTTHQQSHWLFYVPESGSCWLVCLRSMSVFNSPFFFSSVSLSASATYYINQPEDISTQFSSNCYIFSCLSVRFSRSVVSHSATPWTSARQTSLSITNSQSLLKLMSIESVMPSNHLILCHPLLLSHSQFFPASGSFQMSQLFASVGQSSGVSASTSVLRMNIQDWFPLGLTGWIPLQSKGLSRVFSNTTVQKH